MATKDLSLWPPVFGLPQRFTLGWLNQHWRLLHDQHIVHHQRLSIRQ